MMAEGTAPRLAGDEGAVLVEFALVLPLLTLLFLGVFEYGMAWRETSNLGGALRAAARVGASSTDVSGNRPADLYAVQAFGAAMSGARNVTVNRLVVYKSVTSNGKPEDAACLTTVPTGSGTGIVGACNIYSWSQIADPQSNFTASCAGNGGDAWDHFWCPSTRKQRQSEQPDYVGYYANVTYDSVTSLLPSTVTITDRYVVRMDPKVTT